MCARWGYGWLGGHSAQYRPCHLMVRCKSPAQNATADVELGPLEAVQRVSNHTCKLQGLPHGMGSNPDIT
jgi:hypothetical protein